jgi:signal transduction histidine kinase
MKKNLILALLAAAALVMLVRLGAFTALLSANYLPHRFCYLAQPGLIFTNVAMDGLIAASYAVIFASLLWIAARLKPKPGFRGYVWIFVSFGLFIIACAATHAMEIVTVWWPVYPLSAAFKVLCAAASVPTAILFARAAPTLEINLERFLAMLSTAEEERDQARTDLGRSEILLDELREAQVELAALNQQLNSIFECTSDSIMTIDPNWRIVYGNSRAIESLPDFTLGKDYWSCFPTIIGTETEAILRRSMGQRVETAYELFYEPYQTWFRVRIFPSAQGITAFFSSVNQEKLAQQELAAANLLREERILELHRLSAELTGVNQILSSIMDSTTEGIFNLAFDWTISSANHTALTIPGVELGRSYWDCFPPVATLPLGQALRDTMAQRTRADFSLFYEPFQSWFKGQLCPTPTGLALFFQDVSAEKLLEEQLAEEQMLREKRIEVLSVMAGGLAHEISNPLAIIHARASDLKRQSRDGPNLPALEVVTACDSILTTSDRAMKILRGLKGFAREAGSDPMEWASVYNIADQSLDIQQSRFDRHGIKLTMALDPDLPLILCRETQIGQIVTNLLNNAFDAIEQSQCTTRWVVLHASAGVSEICIEVRDSGPGIDDHSRGHLMEPFFTTKSRGLGMGVGLSLSRAIAQDHGGSLALLNEPGPTCFRLILPIDKQLAAA